jgi:hypothetical protein
MIRVTVKYSRGACVRCARNQQRTYPCTSLFSASTNYRRHALHCARSAHNTINTWHTCSRASMMIVYDTSNARCRVSYTTITSRTKTQSRAKTQTLRADTRTWNSNTSRRQPSSVLRSIISFDSYSYGLRKHMHHSRRAIISRRCTKAHSRHTHAL